MIVNKKTCPISFSLILLLTGLHACISNPPPRSDDTHSQIDSLIQIHRINEKLILLSFGADAISAINTEKGTVVIDAGISTGLTQKYRGKIEHEFQHKQFAYVINTHAHHDHYRGNSVFPAARIVGHENGPEEMEQYWKDPAKEEISLKSLVEQYEMKLQDCPPHSEEWDHNFTQKIRYQSAYLDVKKKLPIRKPDFLFSDSLTIHMGDLIFELKYFGRCHSNSDILIHIPELHVLFVGDLMFQYGRPSIRDKSMTDKDIWRSAVAWTEKRMPDIEIVIGGHGQLLNKDDLRSFHKNILDK